ncbi:MAG: PEGA domain-containing protein [Candidatus Saccharibacteria bacterium]|nr:PEGA domain-containing protein [Candidatus Saccharibacteria bacterium]
MNDERIKKRQSLKVILSEAIMVLAVVAMVAVLAFIVSGYWVNSDFKVERQGMIQVSSIPTGANFDIDGESSWLQRTNTSKVIASGEHTITLTKDGYDTWTKKINISEGLLYRLHYPRLFLQDRETERVLNVAGAKMATVSPDNKTLILINDTTEWQKINLNNKILEPQKFSIAGYFPGANLAEGTSKGFFTGEILDYNWDQDGNHILFKIALNNAVEWVLMDVNNAKNTINLSQEFGATFSDVRIFDNSANNLLAVQNGNLHKINIPNKSISAVLVKNVIDFDHYDDEIVFSSSAQGSSDYLIGLVRADNGEATELESSNTPAKVALFKFYDDTYIALLKEASLTLYGKTDFNPISEFTLSFIPNMIKVGHDGEFVIMANGANMATLDMEASLTREWTLEGDNYGWLDNDMIHAVANGELIVYDFDGLNRRILAKNVSDHFPITITDNIWLYYFSDGNLIREKLTQ